MLDAIIVHYQFLSHRYNISQTNAKFTHIAFIEDFPFHGVITSAAFGESIKACLWRSVNGDKTKFSKMLFENISFKETS